VISGGTSLIQDLGKRLQIEIGKWFSEKLKGNIKIISPSGREHMGWVGASILYMQGLLTKGWIQNPNAQNRVAVSQDAQENIDNEE
jgi:actin-related protein